MRRLALLLLPLLCAACAAPPSSAAAPSYSTAPSSATASSATAPSSETAPSYSTASSETPSPVATVILRIYSGVPDPTWTLDEAQAAELEELIEGLAPGEPQPEAAGLGFAGFIVEGLEGATPDTGRVTARNGSVRRESADGVEWLADPDRTAERWLLASGEQVLKPAEVAAVRGEIEATPAVSRPILALYLTPAGVTPADVQELPDLAAIPLEQKPLLAGADFATYDVETHAFTLTPDAEARLIAIDLPVSGRAFVVTVGDERIYTGAFWTPLSSLSYDGVTIMLMADFGSISSDGVYTVELGYPGTGFFEGSDPRSDPRILAAVADLQ